MAFFNVGWSTLIGFEKMGLNSVILISRSAIKSILSPTLVLLGYRALGAVAGYTLSGIFATILCISLSLRTFREIESSSGYSIRSTLALLLSYGFPLAIGGIVNGFGNQFYRFLMSRTCSSEAIGNYGAASNFLIAMTLLTSPIVTVLFPAFSKIDGQKEKEKLAKAFRASVRYSSLFVVPAAMGVMVTSKPLVFTLFGEKYSQAPIFLSLISLGQLLCAIGALSASTLLASQERTGEIMKANLISLAIGVPTSLFLIPSYGIYGLIATILLVSFVTVVIMDYMIFKIYGFSVDFNSSGRILLASSIMASIVYAIERLMMSFAPPIRVMVELSVGLVSYSLLILVLGGIREEDMENLKIIFSKAGVVGRVISEFLEGLELINKRIGGKSR
jgi:O-antigen/teichoic acid export membrane protein